MDSSNICGRVYSVFNGIILWGLDTFGTLQRSQLFWAPLCFPALREQIHFSEGRKNKVGRVASHESLFNLAGNTFKYFS